MSERGFDLKRDGTGIVIFTVSAFFAVLIGKAWVSEASLATATGTAVLADLWVNTLGMLPSFCFTAGMTIVGARLFLRAEETRWLKSAGALALTAVALAILLGSFSQTAGGKLGAAIGGSISSFTHVSVGVIVGLAALGGAIWLGWIRPTDDDMLEPPTLLQTKRALKPDLADGVSRDEALALLPEDLPREAPVLRKLDPTPPKAMPLSPYPEDVRLRGQIPAGAQPLQPKHAPALPESAHDARSVYRWTAPSTELAADAPREDLARAAQPEPLLGREQSGDHEQSGEAIAVTEGWEVEEDLTDDEDRFPVEPAAEEAAPVPPPPRPTWEQPSLFEAEEEPVDAYGTPLELIESLRASDGASAEASEVLEPRAEARDTVAIEVETAEPVDEVSLAIGLDAEEDEAEEEADDEADDEESDEESDEDAEASYDDEESEYETVYDEDDEEEGDEGADDRVSSDVAAADAEQVARVEVPTSAPAAPAAREDRTSRVFESVPVRDVVLQPKAAPADKVERTRVLGGTRQDMLTEAGCLFVERGRVAVSMLQRQYSMDFDAACAVLDELQEMGLIGPYLGGQRRDILLTREQWLEKVGERAAGEATRLADV